MTRASIIAQASPPFPSPASPIPHSLFEGGVAIAIVVYLIKEATALFKKKDEDEAKLNAVLIEDLRRERSEQLDQMQGVLAQVHGSYRALAIAMQRVSQSISGINQTLQQQARTNTEIWHSLRQVQQQNLMLNAKIDRIIDEQSHAASSQRSPQSQSRPHV